MDTLEGILDVSCKELDQIVRAGKYRSRDEIDTAYKLIDIIKDVYEVWEKEDEGSGSQYGDGYSRRGGYNSYNDGMGRTSARGRGRYSSRNGRSYGGYYSRAGAEEEFADELRDLMDHAPDESTRQSIQRMLSQMEQG